MATVKETAMETTTETATATVMATVMVTETATATATEAVMATAMMINTQNKNIDTIMDDLAKSQSVFAIVDKRYKALNLQDRINRNVLLFIELFAEGSPGIGVFILIELLNLAETLQKKVDCNDFSMLYPNGFFTKESVIQIVDR